MTTDFPFEKFLNTRKTSGSSTPNSIEKSNKNDYLLNDIFSGNTIKKEAPLEENQDHSDISPFKPITDAIFVSLEDKIEPVKYNTFIKNKIQIESLDDHKVVFSAQTQFILTTVKTSYLPLLKSILKELMGQEYSIEFRIKDNSKQIEASIPQKSEISFTQFLENTENQNKIAKNQESKNKSSFTLNLSPTQEERKEKAASKYIEHMEESESSKSIDPSKTFDNFIVGPSNNLAFATACAVADDPGKAGKYPCVYFYSDSGLGKTHLLHAVANGIYQNHPELRICLISARDFMKELINAFKDKKISEFQIKYTEYVDVLMIDDIHELKNKNSTQDEFFHIFNFLHNKGKQLIFTSDKSPDKITGIEERVITRLQWGLVVDIQKPDFETRTAILKKKAIDLDLFIQDDVLNLIASSIKSSIRELEGSLIRLQAHAELIEAEIDSEMARDILKLQSYDEKPASTLESVCRAASHYYKIPVADLRSKTRSKDVVRARHISWYLSKNIVGATYEEIGQYYSNRDHSSVIHGVNKITEQLKNDLSISKDIVYLENNI
jgi:chromosomal replication initiator protein